MAHYLLDNSNDFGIPGMDKEDNKPFVVNNRDSIGTVNPFVIVGSDSKFIVETDMPEAGVDLVQVEGFWLYKNSELKAPDDVIEMPRASVDHYTTDVEGDIDVTDCIVELPSPIDKLTCLTVSTLKRLFDLEPDLKKCLDPKKEELYDRLHQ